MLDQLDQVLRWYSDDVRGLLPEGRPLFCTETGRVLHGGSIRNQLAHLLDVEGCASEERFSPHDLRRACATHNYERGVDLVARSARLNPAADREVDATIRGRGPG